MTRTATTLLAGALVAAALALAACSGDGAGDDATGGTPVPAPAGDTVLSSGAMGPGISVPEAIASTLDGPLLVNGFLIEQQGTLRLCEVMMESFPPQCGGASLEVDGLAIETMADLRSEGTTRWLDAPAQVLGEVDGGTLRVSQSVTGG